MERLFPNPPAGPRPRHETPMPYYLRHYFDPDFDYTSLKPRPLPKERADLRNLGYVQNVRPGQLLAELTPLDYLREDDLSLDERFILEQPEFPLGRHVAVDPDNPLRLLALEAGYVFYENGGISVKTLLNVRGDVNFQTGNIDFVGNIHVHQNVAAGFSVKGNDVLVDGGVHNAVIRARNNLAVLGGVRGDAKGGCMLVAGRNMRLSFADKAEMRTGKNLEIKYALHSACLVGGSLLAHSDIFGGVCRVQENAVVRGDLGNDASIPTEFFLGPDPFLSRALHKGNKKREKLRQIVEQCLPLAGHLPPDANECSRRLEKARRYLAAIDHMQARLNECLRVSLRNKAPSTLYVGGTVYPGVIVTINDFSLQVKDPLTRVQFQLEDDRVVASPYAGPL